MSCAADKPRVFVDREDKAEREDTTEGVGVDCRHLRRLDDLRSLVPVLVEKDGVCDDTDGMDA